MNLHEYQGKELLKSYGVKIQEGILCYTPDEVFEAATRLRAERYSEGCVVKAQVHAGGRGKAEASNSHLLLKKPKKKRQIYSA